MQSRLRWGAWAVQIALVVVLALQAAGAVPSPTLTEVLFVRTHLLHLPALFTTAGDVFWAFLPWVLFGALTVLESQLFLLAAPAYAYETPAALSMAWMPVYNLYGTWLLFRAKAALARSNDRSWLAGALTLLAGLHAVFTTLVVAGLLVFADHAATGLPHRFLVVARVATFGIRIALLACAYFVASLTAESPEVEPPPLRLPQPGTGGGMGIACPSCGVGVLQRGQSLLPMLHCAACAGDFVPPAGAAQLLFDELGFAEETLRQFAAKARLASHVCASCERPVTVLELRGVRAAVCLECPTLFLASGELHALSRGRYGQAGAPQRAPPRIDYVLSPPPTVLVQSLVLVLAVFGVRLLMDRLVWPCEAPLYFLVQPKPNGERLLGCADSAGFTGVATDWSPTGRRVSTTEFKMAKPNGDYIEFHANSAPKLKGHFTAGEVSGIWVYEDDHGAKLREETYVSGVIVSETEYWSSGGVARTGSYTLGEKDGLWRSYDKDGRSTTCEHWHDKVMVSTDCSGALTPLPPLALAPSTGKPPAHAGPAFESWQVLFAGQSASWWGTRLTQLRADASPEGKQRYEITRRRAVLNGLEIKELPEGPVSAMPTVALLQIAQEARP